MSKKRSLQTFAVLIALVGPIVFMSLRFSLLETFCLMLFLQIHGIALLARTKGRSACWGGFGFLFLPGTILGLLWVLLLKEKADQEVDFSQGIWRVILGVSIIIGSFMVGYNIQDKARGSTFATMIFMSGALWGYTFYLEGLDRLITRKGLGLFN